MMVALVHGAFNIIGGTSVDVGCLFVLALALPLLTSCAVASSYFMGDPVKIILALAAISAFWPAKPHVANGCCIRPGFAYLFRQTSDG